MPNPYLDYLLDPSFQGINRHFVWSFEQNTCRTVHTKYYLPTAEIKVYDVKMDGQNFFDQPVKNHMRTYNIRKIATGPGVDYITGCLRVYPYLNVKIIS